MVEEFSQLWDSEEKRKGRGKRRKEGLKETTVGGPCSPAVVAIKLRNAARIKDTVDAKWTLGIKGKGKQRADWGLPGTTLRDRRSDPEMVRKERQKGVGAKRSRQRRKKVARPK